MTESGFWNKAKVWLAGLDPVRIEDRLSLGVPDVNYIGGWIELKWVARWPPRGGILQLPHYTPQQKAWHVRRIGKGGRVHVLLGVGSDTLLFDGVTAAKYLGKSNKEELKEVAVGYWGRGTKNMNKELKDALQTKTQLRLFD